MRKSLIYWSDVSSGINRSKEKSGKPTVKVGDEEFDLQTDREGSDDDGDTTLGGGSDDESDFGSEFEDDDFSDNEGGSKKSSSGISHRTAL